VKVLVVGCGSIGERHIRNLCALYPDFTVLTTDVSKQRLSLMQKQYAVEPYVSVEEAFKQKVDAAIICTPPSSHIPLAVKAVENGAHIFIEKPMSNSTDNIAALLERAKASDLKVFVGYCFRFHPGLKKVKSILESGELGRLLFAEAHYGQFLPDWRPWQNYRQSYTSQKAVGGGIILDSSHELDYIRWLVGDIEGVFGFSSCDCGLQVETEAIAGIVLKFRSGIVGQIHVDFVRRDYSRGCEFICSEGTVNWSYEANSVKVYRAQSMQWEIFSDVITDSNEMYLSELTHFIDCVSFGKEPVVNGDEGLKTLQLALAAKESAAKGMVVKL
jgi:predicted dehydrogenase